MQIAVVSPIAMELREGPNRTFNQPPPYHSGHRRIGTELLAPSNWRRQRTDHVKVMGRMATRKMVWPELRDRQFYSRRQDGAAIGNILLETSVHNLSAETSHQKEL
jgi:hypothetical protein